MKSSILVCVTLIVALSSAAGTSVPATWAQQPAPPPLAAAATEEGSWPMSGANPQRTSWTPTEVTGSLEAAWYRPIDPYIPSKAQLILANNTVYVSTAKGLYALDASTGNLKWTYATELPLGNSPTVIGDVAYVGCMDHKLYAIRDQNSTYSMVWSFEVGVDSGLDPNEVPAGFDTNPLVVNNLVIAGNRNGYMYAVDASSGRLVWKFKTDGGIHYSAAFKNGAVYFASDDSYAYAVNVTNGQRIWKSSKLPVTAFHSWWPVVYTNPQTGTDTIVLVGDTRYRMAYPGAGWAGDLQNLDASDWLDGHTGDFGTRDAQGRLDISKSVGYLDARPERRTVFVLDATDGSELKFDVDTGAVCRPGSGNYASCHYPPVFWWGTRSGMRYPAVVGGDGLLYLPFIYNFAGGGTRGQIAGWYMGTRWLKTPAGGTQASDEPLGYAAGGNTIYYNLCCDRMAASFGVDGGGGGSYFGYNLDSVAPNYNIKAMGTTESNAVEVFGDSRSGTGWNGEPAGLNGVYGYHGDQNPPIPYNGMVFMHRGNAVLAFSASGGARSLPLAPTVAKADTPSGVNVDSLVTRLNAEVQAIIAAGHLRPGYSAHGAFDATAERLGYIHDYFHNTSDTILALSRAYPYLSSSLQSQVRTYLQREYADYSPCNNSHIGWQGASREGLGVNQPGFDLPPEIESSANSGPSGGASSYPQTLYALWKWAELAGGNASQLLSSCGDILPGGSSGDPEELNALIAGYQGYVGLAQLAGQPSSSQQATLNSLMGQRAGNLSNTINNSWGGPDAKNFLQYFLVARNFMYLTPELGQYLRGHAGGTVTQVFDYLTTIAPYWMAAKFEAAFNEGSVQIMDDYAALFNAKAWVMNASREDLARYLDGPAFVRGDLFFINNLVTIIEAPSIGGPQTFVDVPPSHPYYGEIEALYRAGYTAGCSTDPLRYCPEGTMNRAESSVFVERGIHTAAYDPPIPASQVFADLTLDSWAAKWVNGLWQDQYTAGCGTNPLIYCPWQGHTRAEGCVFYLRMLNGANFEPPQPTAQTFLDVPLDTWFAKWVQAAYDTGLLGACQSSPELRFCPNDPLTRALAAYMMVQAKGLQ